MKQELTDIQFVEALNKEDDLGMIIRAHIHIEYYLEKYLGSCVPLYEKYKKQITPDYEDKTNLALAMGLNKNLQSLLNGLGSLRNNFAHKPGYVLSKNDVDNLYKCLSSSQKQHFQTTYRETSIKANNTSINYSKLEAKGKLSIIFLFTLCSLQFEHEALLTSKSSI